MCPFPNLSSVYTRFPACLLQGLGFRGGDAGQIPLIYQGRTWLILVMGVRSRAAPVNLMKAIESRCSNGFGASIQASPWPGSPGLASQQAGVSVCFPEPNPR